MRRHQIKSVLPSLAAANLAWHAGPEGYYLHGWEKQFKFLSTKWEKVSQADRIAQVMWRGRTIDKEFPERDALR